MRKILNFLTLVTLLLAPGVARADINFCNQSCQRIRLAYGNEEWYSGALCHVGNETRDEIHGWYFADPGQCVTVETGCHCNWWADTWGNCPGPVLHYFAETEDSATYWGDTQGWNTCTPWSAFDECDYAAGTCPDGRLLPWGMWFYGGGAVCDLNVTFH